MPRLDPHSYADASQPPVRQVTLTGRLDFAARRLFAEATLQFQKEGHGAIDLDTRDLEIESVEDSGGDALAFHLDDPDPVLGSRLRVELPRPTSAFKIRYRTSPNASAMQWLDPPQTAGGRLPYVYTQCQAIHARSVLPIQDTPRVRVTYHARLQIPRNLKLRMAARHLGRTESGDEAVEEFKMPEAIPPYLFAFAAGNLVSRELGPRSAVWAEPELVDGAAWEFESIDRMLTTAERLFGRYPWERFDVLVMPPSFPYGGMENPRLAFLTPTLLAGDRSLVNVVAHELAHSWTGNLVTNASAEHFWLNEGFTVFAERKILEALEGPAMRDLHAALGRKALSEALARFATRPELTQLETNLWGVDPDEAFSEIPYEKGYLFLRALEDAAGEAKFAEFLHRYVAALQFKSITTGELMAFARGVIPEALDRVDCDAWLKGAGLPAYSAGATRSPLDDVPKGHALPPEAAAKSWGPAQWQLFLESEPRPAPHETLAELERRYGFGQTRNCEILVSWLTLALASGYAPAIGRATELLHSVGRMKYLRPLYSALASHPASRYLARTTFNDARPKYHPIAVRVIDGLLREMGL